jgi:hypothetical protein
MKLTKAFRCVPPGEIYPVEIAAGEECPEDYEDSAREQGCLGGKPSKGTKPANEIRAVDETSTD